MRFDKSILHLPWYKLYLSYLQRATTKKVVTSHSRFLWHLFFLLAPLCSNYCEHSAMGQWWSSGHCGEGALMCRSLADVKWNNPTHAVTAFLIVIIIPLTYSIAYGLIAGIGCYGIMEGTFFLLSFVGISKPVYDEFPVWTRTRLFPSRSLTKTNH
jgi:xanthine/uracil/vitamin C permease (AzgA family)